MTSRNEQGRLAWDKAISMVNLALELDPLLSDPARSCMTRDQADVIFGTFMAVAHSAGNVRVIRETQSSKSQLMKAVK